MDVKNLITDVTAVFVCRVRCPDISSIRFHTQTPSWVADEDVRFCDSSIPMVDWAKLLSRKCLLLQRSGSPACRSMRGSKMEAPNVATSLLSLVSEAKLNVNTEISGPYQ
jgi:hypothetical protein